MQIDALERSVKLAVGELATFRNQRSQQTGGGIWRAALGQKWHQFSSEQTRSSNREARFEEYIEGVFTHRDWTFQIKGRIDQVIPEAGKTILREVKTIQSALPAAPEDLSKTYPEYFAQAAAYLKLARLLPKYSGQVLTAELLFITLEDGTAQSIQIREEEETLLDHQLERLTHFLNDRRSCRVRLNELKIEPAFETLRDGQNEVIEQLKTATLANQTVLMQAPTGFGKTGIVLEHALRKMQEGFFDRCLYLTSKSTGQVETIRQLRRMIGDNIRFIQMRNRHEHRIDSPKHQCTGDRRCDRDLEQSWLEADFEATELFANGTFTIQQAKDLGSQTGICPYALTKACLPHAEIWIGDSNYLFAPASRHVFTEVHGFDAKKTLVIIDEAHNLPSRNADALSISFSAVDLVFAVEELRAAGAGRRLLSSLESLANSIDLLPAGKVLNADQIYDLHDLAEECKQLIQEGIFDYENTAQFALETVWKIPELTQRLNELNSHWLHWCPQAGNFAATCLDASEWTADCLRAYGSTILMSATLDPIEDFMVSMGLPQKEVSFAIGQADWRLSAYDVAIDNRVDTRLRHRNKYYEKTARTISTMAAHSPGNPVAVFFPSYQYAENIAAYLSAIDPSIRIASQQRGIDLPAQIAFIDESLIMADVLFLIVGSSFAEGIDQLGGRIASIMMVGPALPEVSPIQTAKLDAHPELSREQAFERVYIIPAMRRIHQALGRIVRAPGQKAKVLLHCKRYQEPGYSKHLNSEYQSSRIIQKTSGLHLWLSEVSP